MPGDSVIYYEALHDAEASVLVDASASCYVRAKNVLVQSVVIPEFELCHIEWKILFADLMKRPDHATLEDRPETFDSIGMHSTNHILPLSMIDNLVRILFCQLPISHPLIGHQRADIIRHGFTHE